MKTFIFLTALGAILFCGQSAFPQGALTPSGAPASSMKSLEQIEPRTPIAAAPYFITNSGSYYLITNLTTTVSNAITIVASGVTLDLNGFTISSTVANSLYGGSAILLADGIGNIAILNGHIRSGVTTNGLGGFAGSGFLAGINYAGSGSAATRVIGITVVGCRSYGIHLSNPDSLVESCTVRIAGNSGIDAFTVKDCTATLCGSVGIFGDQITDCRGDANGGPGGIGIEGTVAKNCFGTTIGTGSYGLFASIAENCYGYNYGTGYGLYGNRLASHCYGQSVGGVGLFAYNAVFCSGNHPGGTAIQATLANGCLAIGGTNIITTKYNMP